MPNITKTDIAYNGFLKIHELEVTDESGKVYKRELMVRPNAVAAIIYNTKTTEFLFTKQWRPIGEYVIELVAGTLDHVDEDPIEAIKREIIEEIGYKVNNIDFICNAYVSPGGTSERVSIYYVEVSEKIANGGGLESENESIETVALYVEEMMNTDICDLKTIVGVQYAINKYYKV